MALFGLSKKAVDQRVQSALAEQRASLENPSVSLTDAAAWNELFGSWTADSGVSVDAEKAMGIAAYWAGVSFLSATIASVPLYLYTVTEEGSIKAENNPLGPIINEAPNDETSSFYWRQWSQICLLQHGRSYTLIQRNRAGRVMNLWPLEYEKVTVERKNGKKRYTYKSDNVTTVYDASDILDLVWMPKGDGLGHYDPVQTLRNPLGASIAMDQYAAKFFSNGGVPPLQLVGPMNSPGAVKRAATDITEALKAAKDENRPVLPMPLMHELKQIGFDPQKGQMIEARRFQVEEIARILNLPPIFLQDLTHGTFSNTEQQDLHVVKHGIRQWFRRWEDEMNLKLIARRNRRLKIRFDEDELLRGDFKTRVEGYAQAISNALYTPDEAREGMGLPQKGGEATKLHVQGATVPLGSQQNTGPQPAAADGDVSNDETA